MARDLNRRFLLVMREIEQHLEVMSRESSFVGAAYDQIAGGPLTAEDARTLEWAWEIRNLLAHQQVDGADPVEATAPTVRAVERVRNRLTERAPTVLGLLGEVVTVGPDESAAAAANLMAVNDYSCLPVEIGGEIVGAVDSDMLMHWIGETLPEVELLEDLTIGQLRQRWPDPPLGFARIDAPQREVVARFETALRDERPLAAILLTADGSAQNRPQGIITPWDVPSLHR